MTRYVDVYVSKAAPVDYVPPRLAHEGITPQQWAEAGLFQGYDTDVAMLDADGNAVARAPIGAYAVGARCYVQAQGQWRRGIAVKVARTRVYVLYRNDKQGTAYVKASGLEWVCLEAGATTTPEADPLDQADDDTDERERFAGARVVACLEGIWAKIRTRHPDLPRVVLIIGSGVEGGAYKLRGHWAALRWRVEDGADVGEVKIAGERMADGPAGVLSTLLHEAGHALAHVRKIKDTSRGGRYHNSRYRDLAESVGLVTSKGPRHGWHVTELSPHTRDVYHEDLAELHRVLSGYRHAISWSGKLVKGPGPKPTDDDDQADDDKPKKASGRGLLECSCAVPRKVRVSRKIAELGPISCGVCGSEFLPVEAS